MAVHFTMRGHFKQIYPPLTKYNTEGLEVLLL